MSGADPFPPGRLAVEYCRRRGWTLLKRNIMVEGDSDVRYFELANRLYHSKSGLRLLGGDLGCFSAGSGQDGGTDGIAREYASLRRIIDTDRDAASRSLFRVTALLDDDPSGRACAATLESTWRYRLGRDFCLLRRSWPMKSNEPNVLAQHLKQQTCDVPTEIEDLLAPSLLIAFGDERPGALDRRRLGSQGEHHYDLPDNVKGALWVHTRTHAMLEDVSHLVECLRAMRFYLGLPVDGIR